MRNAGAARRRREPEPEPPDPIAEAVADLGRLSAETGELVGRMNLRDGEIAASAARIESLPAECASAGQMAAQGEKITDRQTLQVIETISLAAHWAEAREVLERVEPQLGTIAMMREAWIAEGRRREAAERDVQPRVPRGRHAARSRHLKVAGGIAASSAVAASLVAGSAVIASQDSAAVRHWSPSPVSVRLHAGPADSAVLVPSSSPRAYLPSPRPSMAAASARPAPTASPSPPPAASSTSAAPSPSASVSADPVLNVPRLLDLGDSILGHLTLSAEGQAVTWTATKTDGITLSSYGGVVVPGQALNLEVTDPTGDGGWVYISFGGTTIPVQVTSSLGVPALGL